jgi:hypothetical protein
MISWKEVLQHTTAWLAEYVPPMFRAGCAGSCVHGIAQNATLERIARWPQAARRIPGVSSNIPARSTPSLATMFSIS